MKKKVIKKSLILLLSLCLVSLALAQRQTGSIAGKITDNEGAPLPGASVTLSGPAMMGTLTYTVNICTCNSVVKIEKFFINYKKVFLIKMQLLWGVQCVSHQKRGCRTTGALEFIFGF